MYAVIRTGGKQYRVQVGDQLKVEKLPGKVGEEVKFEEVLMIGGDNNYKIGTPRVAGASVTAKIVEQDRDKKILVFKFRRRKDSKRLLGHRQYYTRLKVTGINAG